MKKTWKFLAPEGAEGGGGVSTPETLEQYQNMQQGILDQRAAQKQQALSLLDEVNAEIDAEVGDDAADDALDARINELWAQATDEPSPENETPESETPGEEVAPEVDVVDDLFVDPLETRAETGDPLEEVLLNAVTSATDPSQRARAQAALKFYYQKSFATQAPEPQAEHKPAERKEPKAAPVEEQPAEVESTDAIAFREFIKIVERDINRYGASTKVGNLQQLAKAAFDGKPILFDVPQITDSEDPAQVRAFNYFTGLNNRIRESVEYAVDRARDRAENAVLRRELHATKSIEGKKSAEAQRAHEQQAASERLDRFAASFAEQLGAPELVTNPYITGMFGTAIKERAMQHGQTVPMESIIKSAALAVVKQFPALFPTAKQPGKVAPVATPAQKKLDNGATSLQVTPDGRTQAASPRSLSPAGRVAAKPEGGLKMQNNPLTPEGRKEAERIFQQVYSGKP